MELQDISLATVIAPEDLRVGDFVALMNDIDQYPVRGAECDWTGKDGPPRIHVVSVRTVAQHPAVYRVLSIALPFVLVEDQSGSQRLVTVRAADLARLPAGLGRRAMKELDRRRRVEARKRQERARRKAVARDAPGAGACGAD